MWNQVEGWKGKRKEGRKKGTTRQSSNYYGCPFLELFEIYIFKPPTFLYNPHI
jgi:hypothetical protein